MYPKITAQDIVQAYKTIGLKPLRSRIYDKSVGGCCALGALYIAEHGLDKCMDTSKGAACGWYQYMDDKYGREQSWGIQDGFDCSSKIEDHPEYKEHSAQRVEAFIAAQEAYKIVIGE